MFSSKIAFIIFFIHKKKFRHILVQFLVICVKFVILFADHLIWQDITTYVKKRTCEWVVFVCGCTELHVKLQMPLWEPRFWWRWVGNHCSRVTKLLCTVCRRNKIRISWEWDERFYFSFQQTIYENNNYKKTAKLIMWHMPLRILRQSKRNNTT